MNEPTMDRERILGRSRRWQSYWVWPRHADAGSNRVALFRGVVDLARAETCRLLITACSQYRLWVDGELIDDGPAPSASHHTLYDEHALKLNAGRHVIAALVRTWKVDWPLRGGLLAELVADDGRVLGGTGESWRGVPGEAWNPGSFGFHMNKLSPYQEHCDGRRLPIDWQIAGFDDRDWPTVEIIKGRGDHRPPKAGPWSHLAPRPIPPLERTTFRPSRIVATESVLAIRNRNQSHDASIEVSQAGVPLTEGDGVRIDHSNALVAGEDGCELQGLAPSRDEAWDGVRDPCMTLGFEEEMTAFIEIELTAPEGVEVLIGSAERLLDGQFNNTIEARFTERYVTRAGRLVFRSLCWRAFRYLRLRFGRCYEPVQLHAVRAIRVRTPMGPAHDIEQNARLDQIDWACRRTMRLCCVDGMFDTPWREAAQWLGDVAMATLPGLHWVYGETALTGKFLMQAGLNSRSDGILCNLSNAEPSPGVGNIPDYSLWWLYGLHEHRWYTGDDGWYHTFYPEAQRIVRWFARYLNDDGLLEDVPCWFFIDWANTHKDGISSSGNAMFVMACDILAEMAELIGDANTKQWVQAMAARIREEFIDTFYDTDRQVVIDAVIDRQPSQRISEHGIAGALFADCIPADLAEGLIERAWGEERYAEDWVECQPFFTRIVLEALARHSRTDLAMKVIEARWGRRFIDRGHDTCLEEWTCNGSWRTGEWSNIQRTTSHAWSAAASEFFRRRLTGMELIEPGGRRVRVKPYLGDEPYTATALLRHGSVTVAYEPGAEPRVTATGDVTVVDQSCSRRRQ